MYQFLATSERDEIIAQHLHAYLAPLGLTQITPRKWVDGSHPPARRMFELALMKGASVRAHWGYSLDFVPAHFCRPCVLASVG
jgi:hypothetical protein